MKPALLRAYAEMMPRLQAEEELRAIATLAVGTGAAEKSDRRAYVRDLQRAAAPKSERRRGTLADVSAAGIAVEEVPVG